MPARCERSGLGLTVTDDAQREQIGVVEHGAVCVQERVPELAALVDRPRRLRCHVARDPARKRELPEQPPETFLVVTDVAVDLGVGPVEVGAGDEAWAAVAGAGDVERVDPTAADRAGCPRPCR